MHIAPAGQGPSLIAAVLNTKGDDGEPQKIETEDKQRQAAIQSERKGSEKEIVQDICPSD